MNNPIKLMLLMCLFWVPLTYGESFTDLPADIKITLSPLEAKWDGLSAEKQQKLIQGASRWNALGPEQQDKAKARFQRFSQLPNAQRTKAIERLQKYQTLPKGKREDLQKSYQKL